MTLLACGVGFYALLLLIWPAFRGDFVNNIFLVSPSAFVTHLVGGVMAIVLGAFQVNESIRTRYLSVHRWVGRCYVLAVGLSGSAGFVLALEAFGGRVSQWGFGLMALCWLAATIIAFRHIRHGCVAQHRNWMIRSYSLTLAGVTLRIYLGLCFAAGLSFSVFYPVLAWLCWLPNLLLAEWFIRRQRPQVHATV